MLSVSAWEDMGYVPFPVPGESWREYAEHCLTHDPMPRRHGMHLITEQDAELLSGEPVPLRIVVPVVIEE